VLYDRGVRCALLEGGPTLAGAFLAAGLVDEVVGYVAPKLLGAGATALGTAGIASIDAATELELVDVARIGPDVRLTAVVKPTAGGVRGQAAETGIDPAASGRSASGVRGQAAETGIKEG
jgi:hypothetical protein